MPNFKAVVKDASGVVYTLSDNTYVGAVQPGDPNKTIWFDTAENNIKVCTNGAWSVIGPGGAAIVTTPTNMPVGPSVIIVTGTGVTDGGSAQLSFASIPPAGSAVDIIILPQPGPDGTRGHGWTLIVPTADWNGTWISDGVSMPGDTILAGQHQASSDGIEDAGTLGVLRSDGRNILIPGNRSADPSDTGQTTPVYIRAISDGARVYYVYQACATR